jgi:hypothetical protein
MGTCSFSCADTDGPYSTTIDEKYESESRCRTPYIRRAREEHTAYDTEAQWRRMNRTSRFAGVSNSLSLPLSSTITYRAHSEYWNGPRRWPIVTTQ